MARTSSRNTLEERSRLTLRAHDECHIEALPLFQRIEKERRSVFAKRQILPVLDDPYDFHHRPSGPSHPLPHGVFSRPETLRQGLVHHHDGRGVHVVGVGERTSTNDPDAHGVEVVARDHIPIDGRRPAILCGLEAFGCDRVLVDVDSERNHVDPSHRLHGRKRTHAFTKLVVKLNATLALVALKPKV